MKRKTIIVSGVNLIEGGTLTIYRQCLDFLDNFANDEYRIIAFVNNKDLFNNNNIEFKEIKWAKKKWTNRLFCEYIYFYFVSRKLKPYLWFSLHDMTPTVKADIRAVYCHNATPFQTARFQDLRYSYKVFLFTLFYRFLYRINIKQNNYLIVQQNWFRNAFSEIFNISKNKIIVAYPLELNAYEKTDNTFERKNETYHFFYPSFPRPFKNFEILCEATKKLEEKGVKHFEVSLTLSGRENLYSLNIYKKYHDLQSIKFIGLLSKKEMDILYENTDCLVFPSRLESWGLPLSEFSVYNKPILAADLPYAHEAASDSKLTAFFNVDNPDDLAFRMEALIRGETHFLAPCPVLNVSPPFTKSWEELFRYLLSK